MKVWLLESGTGGEFYQVCYHYISSTPTCIAYCPDQRWVVALLSTEQVLLTPVLVAGCCLWVRRTARWSSGGWAGTGTPWTACG